MRTWISKAAICALAAAPLASVDATQVKGLQLGATYADEQLARTFPGARCVPHGKTALTYCVLPTTFLGRPTSAEVMRDKENRLIDFSAFLPVADEPAALRILTARFGKPQREERAGTVAHVWPEAENGDLRVEAARVNNELRINFYSHRLPAPELAPLDPNDL
jgi:hypothetical protein